MNFYDIEQRTEEWFALRMGKFTASTMAGLFSSPTTQAYKNSIYKVAFERIYNELPEDFRISTAYMERGTELEPKAIEAYEEYSGFNVNQGGFFELNEYVGASPDGIVNTLQGQGGVEVKCPAFTTTMEYNISSAKAAEKYNAKHDDKVTGVVPSKYLWQIHSQMYVCNFIWIDFVVYHPQIELMVVRVDRDESKIEELKEKLKIGIKKVDEVVKFFKGGE